MSSPAATRARMSVDDDVQHGGSGTPRAAAATSASAGGDAGPVGHRQRDAREQIAPVAPGVQVGVLVLPMIRNQSARRRGRSSRTVSSVARAGARVRSARDMKRGSPAIASRTIASRCAAGVIGAPSARAGRSGSSAARRAPARRGARRASATGARCAAGRRCRRTGRCAGPAGPSVRTPSIRPVARPQEVAGRARFRACPRPGASRSATSPPAASTSGCSRCARPTAGRTACRGRTPG